MSPSTSGRKVLVIGTAVFGGLLVGTVAAATTGGPQVRLDVAAGVDGPTTTGAPRVHSLAATDPVMIEIHADSTTSTVAEPTTEAPVVARSTAAPAAAVVATTAPPTTAAPAATPPTTAPAPVEPAPESAGTQVDPAPAPSPDPAPAPSTTATTAPPPTTASPASGSVEEAIRAWFPDVYSQAYNVARCESGLNPNAVSSGGGNHGLFQINSVHRNAFTQVTGQPWSSVYNAYYNSQFARYLYNQSGWRPWGCRP